MPQRRVFTGRRKQFRRRRAAPKVKVPKEITWGQFATKAWSGVQQIRKLINVEKHTVDTTVGAAIDNAGAVTHLTAVANGDTNSTRTGNSILAHNLEVNLSILKHASSVGGIVRIIIFVDKQQVADSSPTVATVLNSVDVLSHLHIDIQSRFRILHDELISLDAAHVNVNRRFDNSLTGTHIIYNGTASSDIQRNGVHLLLLSNEPTNTPTVNIITRFHFFDN